MQTELRADGTVFRYRVQDGCAHIAQCSSDADEIDIPGEFGGHPVVELGERSFANLGRVRRIRCPQGLLRIGPRAFEGCSSLQSVNLNDGLVEVRSRAFSQCPELSVVLPRSVKRVGACLAGPPSPADGGRRAGPESAGGRHARIGVDEASAFLFVAEDGVMYARQAGGLAAVDGSQLDRPLLRLDPATVEIGADSFARNARIERALLPEGLARIGERAFEGCRNLTRADLPRTLESLGDSAFSGTALESLELPAACADVAPRGLDLGPTADRQYGRAYDAAPQAVGVFAGNPSFRLVGPVLCRRLESGALQAELCSRNPRSVRLTADVARVLPSAFAGTPHIDDLRIHDGLAVEGTSLLPHRSCGRLTIDFSHPIGGLARIAVELPRSRESGPALDAVVIDHAVNVERFLAAYDVALSTDADALERARLVAARLAQPAYLERERRAEFESFLKGALADVCVQFGMRGWLDSFENLIDAGLLDQGNIPDVMDALSAHGDASAAAYLLQAKQARFGTEAWDYGI